MARHWKCALRGEANFSFIIIFIYYFFIYYYITRVITISVSVKNVQNINHRNTSLRLNFNRILSNLTFDISIFSWMKNIYIRFDKFSLFYKINYSHLDRSEERYNIVTRIIFHIFLIILFRNQFIIKQSR